MELRGTVRSWNEDKGFGFIRPDGAGSDLFAHASSLHGSPRLAAGDTVLYRVGRDKQGRPCATSVRRQGEPVVANASRGGHGARRPARQRKNAAKVQRLGLKLVVLTMLLVLPLGGSLAMLAEHGSLVPLAAYLGASLMAFLLYWKDKQSALQQRWRTPEGSLHLLELVGGWPGALVAQQVLRHKTRKLSFQLVYWVIVALHQAVWIDLLFLQRLVPAYLERLL